MEKHSYFFFIIFIALLAPTNPLSAQTSNDYTISFEDAIHNEAEITATFKNLESGILEVRMSRTSPGRYALHEFAKNVYSVQAFNSKGEKLEITRPNPYQWDVSGHDGTVVFKYTLFANHGDGTYAQIDETHAHLNIPATFVFARNYGHRPVKVTFQLPENSNWKIATQLKHLEGNTYFAPNTYYFLDSPTEIADLHIRERKVEGKTIRIALHTPASDKEVDDYFEKVMGIVEAQRSIYGELPDLDFGEYTFLLCYMPNADGDGMEHRNSTYVTSSKPLARPLGETGIGTVSHEFFHTWNVERIRPKSLEPFDFENANMSGELWFAEGFTSYYTNLSLARAGIRTAQQYIEGLDGALSFVINSPGRTYFNPIEMSYQAPFVDAATAVDPNNRANTFISYYTYGSVLGLGLDLELRAMDKGLSLDGFMKLMWQNYGKTEIPYSVRDIQATLAEYVNEDFSNHFFENYIFDSKLPDYKKLLATVGVKFEKKDPNSAWMGGQLIKKNGSWVLRSNATKGSPLYNAGIKPTDEFVSIGGLKLKEDSQFKDIMKEFKSGQKIDVVFIRWDQEKSVSITLEKDESFETSINPRSSKKETERRMEWVKAKS